MVQIAAVLEVRDELKMKGIYYEETIFPLCTLTKDKKVSYNTSYDKRKTCPSYNQTGVTCPFSKTLSIM